jgi:hypothetical protein
MHMNKKLSSLQYGIFIALFVCIASGIVTWIQVKKSPTSQPEKAVETEQFLQEGSGAVDIYLQYTDVTDSVYTVEVLAKSSVNKQLYGADLMYKFKTSDLELTDIVVGPNLTLAPNKATILTKPATMPEYLSFSFSVLVENMNQSISVVNNNVPAKLATLKFKRLSSNQTLIEAVSPNNTVALSDSGTNQIARAGDLTLPNVAPASCTTLTTQATCNGRVECLWDTNTCVPISNINGASACREQGGQPTKFTSSTTLAPNLCAGIFNNIGQLDLTQYYCQCPAGRCWDGSGCSAVISKCVQNGHCEAGENSTNCAADCGVTAKPELTVYETSKYYSPQSPKIADSVYVRFTVKNDGNAAAAASTAKLYVDVAGSPTSTTPVATTLSIPQLAAGGSSQLSHTFAANYFTAGLHTVSAVLDAGNTVSESNEGNNYIKVAEFTVTSGTAAVQTRETCKVGDLDENKCKALTGCGIYLCNDTCWPTGTSNETACAIIAPTTREACRIGDNNKVTCEATPGCGFYTCNNTCWPAGTANTTACPVIKPDLKVTNMTVTPSSPKTSDSVDVSITVKNIGNAAAGTSVIKFFMDPTSVPTATTVTAANYTQNVKALAVGESYNYTFGYGPNLLNVGNHTMYTILDTANSVSESDENNVFGPGTFTVSSSNTSCSQVTVQTTCTTRSDCMWHGTACRIKGDYDSNGSVTIQDIVYILNKWGTEFTDAQIGPAIIIVLNTMQW